MKRAYHCPHCSGRLNPNVKIILRAERRGRTGLLLFSPQPGSYRVIVPEVFDLEPGETVRFSCPICAHDLTSGRDASMAEIRFANSSGRAGTVIFSRAFGRHETYFVTREEVKCFGEHAATPGLNFWGSGPGSTR